MKQREIKFRAWFKGSPDKPNDKPAFISGFNMVNFHSYYTKGLEPHVYRYDREWKLSDIVLQQFTGKLGHGNRELYDGDIVFYEEAEDGGDRRFYIVITWIPEWSMFASLHIDEYRKFIEGGADALDESMFWTYTLEGSESYHYAGNIFETPEILDPQGK